MTRVSFRRRILGTTWSAVICMMLAAVQFLPFRLVSACACATDAAPAESCCAGGSCCSGEPIGEPSDSSPCGRSVELTSTTDVSGPLPAPPTLTAPEIAIVFSALVLAYRDPVTAPDPGLAAVEPSPPRLSSHMTPLRV